MRTVAAFDFDKTLSTRDNAVPFLRLIGGRARFARAVLTSAPLLALGRRDDAKAQAVRSVFTGQAAAAVRDNAARFATEILEHYLRDEAVARAAWHRDQGHDLVIVSASFDVYVEPVAEQLGFDAVLATGLEVGADGLLTGRLDGPNVRSVEKVVRLDAWLDDPTAVVWAYGDSAGDEALLTRADHAWLVRGDGSIRPR